MFRIALATMRNRWTGFIGAFVGTALAVAMVVCWGILLDSAARSPVRPHRYAATPVVVAGNQTLNVHYGQGESSSALLPERVRVSSALVARIQRLPEVARVVPDISFPVSVNGHQATAHNWAGHLVAGQPPRAGEVVLGTSIAGRSAIGGTIAVRGATGVSQLKVTGITNGSGVFVPDQQASTMAGVPGKLDAIGVFPKPGVNIDRLAHAVKAVVGNATVLSGDARGRAEFPDLVQAKSDLSAIAGSIGGVAVMVAIFVVAGTLSVSVQQRGREIALLRAVAATPRQIRRMVAGEGLLVAVVAALAGCLPGWLLASIVHNALVHKGIVPAGLRLEVGWIPFVVAGGSAVLVVQIAGIAAGRRASKIRPTAALAESTVQPRLIGVFRLLLGLGALAGAVALLSVSLSTQGDDAAGASAGVVMILMVAVGLLGPLVAWVGSTLAGVPLRRISRIGGFLAAVHAKARSRRLASALTPVALTVSLAFITVFLQATVTHAQAKQSSDRLVADRVVTAGAPGVPTAAVNRLNQLSGVDSAVGLLPTQIEYGHDLNPYDAQVATGGRLDRVLSLNGAVSTNTVAISTDLARTAHVHIGQRLTFRLGDGTPVDPKIAGIYANPLGFGDVLLPWSLAAGHVDNPAAASVLVRVAHGAKPNLRAAYPGLQVADRAAYQHQQDRDQALNTWLNYLLLGVIVGYTAVAVANTLVMTTTERRREFALLRLIGATSRQVLRMMRWEAALIALLGITIGTGIGYVTLVGFSRALGPGTTPYVPPLSFAVLAVGAAALAVTATLVPARRAMRHAPIEAVGIRE